MNIGFLGSSKGLTDNQIESLIEIVKTLNKNTNIHHLDSSYADLYFHHIVKNNKKEINITIHTCSEEHHKMRTNGGNITRLSDKPKEDSMTDMIESVTKCIVAADKNNITISSEAYRYLSEISEKDKNVLVVFPNGQTC